MVTDNISPYDNGVDAVLMLAYLLGLPELAIFLPSSVVHDMDTMRAIVGTSILDRSWRSTSRGGHGLQVARQSSDCPFLAADEDVVRTLTSESSWSWPWCFTCP